MLLAQGCEQVKQENLFGLNLLDFMRQDSVNYNGIAHSCCVSYVLLCTICAAHHRASYLRSYRPLVIALKLKLIALAADCTASTVVAGVQILLARLVRQGGGVGQGEVEGLGLLARNLKYDSAASG